MEGQLREPSLEQISRDIGPLSHPSYTIAWKLVSSETSKIFGVFSEESLKKTTAGHQTLGERKKRN